MSARLAAYAARGLALAGALAAALAAAPASAHAQRVWTASAVVGRAEHRVDLGRAGTIVGVDSPVERSSGTVVGGSVDLGATPWLEVEAHALGGRLEAPTSGLGRDMGEVGVRASVLAFPWLVFQAGALSRGFQMTEGRQHWSALATGAEARLDLSGGRVRGIVRASVLPAVSVSGDLDRPDLAVATAAGLEMHRGFFAGAVMYSLERYDFPSSVDAGRRLEQLGMITAKLGVRF
ncbi:MAG TPA: hypothetical protein VKA84_24960 [Gemmatimonadaceae bacterium]|nr:hypothetical protein [Gemmatimonadaceae bacterium]